MLVPICLNFHKLGQIVITFTFSYFTPFSLWTYQLFCKITRTTFYSHFTDHLNEPIQETHKIPSNLPNSNVNEFQNRIRGILTKYSNGIWLSKIPQFYKEMYEEELNTDVLKQLEHWPHICMVSLLCFIWKQLLYLGKTLNIPYNVCLDEYPLR